MKNGFHFPGGQIKHHEVSRPVRDFMIGNKIDRRTILRPNWIDAVIKGAVIIPAYFTFLIRNQSLDVEKLVPIPGTNMWNKVACVDG